MKTLILALCGLVPHFFSFGQDSVYSRLGLEISLVTGVKIFQNVSSPNQYNHVHYRVDPIVGLDIFSEKLRLGCTLKRDYFLGISAQNSAFDLNSYYEDSYVDVYKQIILRKNFKLNLGIANVWHKEETIISWGYQSSSRYYFYKGIFPHAGILIKWLSLDIGYFIEYIPELSSNNKGIWFSAFYKIHLNSR